jgi:hypothetical protein
MDGGVTTLTCCHNIYRMNAIVSTSCQCNFVTIFENLFFCSLHSLFVLIICFHCSLMLAFAPYN